MAGDYSRSTFDAARHFSAVLMQQGRVQLDADWNEQRDVATHYLRALAADVIGPHGGSENSFDIQPATRYGNPIRDFTIARGHYYVDGILAENESEAQFTTQDDYRPADGTLQDGTAYLVYLDVWERELTALQDDSIREVALKGADTAARLRVVWQVRVIDVDEYGGGFDPARPDEFLDRVRPTRSTGLLRARAVQEGRSAGPCGVDADATFRGPENQLYRVQIHRGGDAEEATFVWSRDNASVALPIAEVHDDAVTVQTLGPDGRRSVRAGDWVQVVDDRTDLQPNLAPLVKVHGVDPVRRLVTLVGGPISVDMDRHPMLRRWDHGRDRTVKLVDGALPVSAGSWVNLEDGVQVWFEPGPALFRTGDYWQITARTATGDVEWPGDPEQPEALPPRGIEHHVAPLARILVAGSGITVQQSYRYRIEPIARPV